MSVLVLTDLKSSPGPVAHCVGIFPLRHTGTYTGPQQLYVNSSTKPERTHTHFSVLTQRNGCTHALHNVVQRITQSIIRKST